MVVTVFVVDRQQLQVFPFKLPTALGADPTMDLEGLLAVVGIGGFIA